MRCIAEPSKETSESASRSPYPNIEDDQLLTDIHQKSFVLDSSLYLLEDEGREEFRFSDELGNQAVFIICFLLKALSCTIEPSILEVNTI